MHLIHDKYKKSKHGILYNKRTHRQRLKKIYKEFAEQINRSNKDYKLDHVPFMPV